MSRYVTTLTPLSLLFVAVLFLASCSTSEMARRHYGNNMYVKAGKPQTELKKETAAPAREATTEMAEAKRLDARKFTNDMVVKPVQKISGTVAKVVPVKRNNAQHAADPYAGLVASASKDAPIVITNAATAQTAERAAGTALYLLVVLGIILIIVGIVTLALEIIPLGGWLGLIIAGLLIILLATLFF